MTDTAPTLGRRAMKTAATRRAIGAAAIELFVERGFAATTIDDIAESAGVSRRSFFNYFDTKQAAAFPDHEARLEWLRSTLAALDEVSDEAALAIIVDEIRSFIQDDMHRERYGLLLHIPELREQDMRDDLDYEDTFRDYFLRGNDSPSPAQRFEAHRRAAQIVGTFRAALTTWGSVDGDFDPAAAIQGT